MHGAKLSTGRIIVGVIGLLIIFCAITCAIIKSSKPVILDAAYLNGDVLLADKYLIDIVGKVELEDNVVICLCTTADNHLLATYLDKQEQGYSCFYNATLSNNLAEGKYNYIDFTPIELFSPHKDKTFYLSVFSNPQDDSIMINGQSVPIQKISFTMGKKDYFIGFWCTSLAKDSVLQFE